MVDNNFLRVIAENKVKELEAETSQLEEELKGEEFFVNSAWSEYGSELAGDLCDGMTRIKGKISNTERQISCLKKFIDGNPDISQESYLRAQCREFDKEINRLNDLKNSTNVQLEEIVFVKSLLSITF